MRTYRKTTVKRYYKRRRSMPVLENDGTLTDAVEAMTTRYYCAGRRNHDRNVYYYGGRFYVAEAWPTSFRVSTQLPDGWTHVLRPIGAATCTDRFLSQTLEQGKAAPVELHVVDGIATATGCKGTDYEGVAFLEGGEDPDYIEDLLDLKPTNRRRPTAA